MEFILKQQLILHVLVILQKYNLSRETIGKIQIITTCDGFTDGANSDTKRDHEQFLYQSLHEIIKSNKKQPEVEIAKSIGIQSKTNNSYDNISVAIQTITHNTPAFCLEFMMVMGALKHQLMLLIILAMNLRISVF